MLNDLQDERTLAVSERHLALVQLEREREIHQAEKRDWDQVKGRVEQLKRERDALKSERDALSREKAAMQKERDTLLREKATANSGKDKEKERKERKELWSCWIKRRYRWECS